MHLEEEYTLLHTKICGLTKNFQPLYMCIDMWHSFFHCCIFLSRLWIRKAVLILWPNDNSPFGSEHWFLIILIPLVCFILSQSPMTRSNHSRKCFLLSRRHQQNRMLQAHQAMRSLQIRQHRFHWALILKSQIQWINPPILSEASLKSLWDD